MPSFPRSAWECTFGRSASRPIPAGAVHPLVIDATQSVRVCVPSRSVGTRSGPVLYGRGRFPGARRGRPRSVQVRRRGRRCWQRIRSISRAYHSASLILMLVGPHGAGRFAHRLTHRHAPRHLPACSSTAPASRWFRGPSCNCSSATIRQVVYGTSGRCDPPRPSGSGGTSPLPSSPPAPSGRWCTGCTPPSAPGP